MGNYLFLILLLACPLMMVFMMRGMHGGQSGNAKDGHVHGAGGGCHGSASSDASNSLDDLRHQRDELDRQIEEREAVEPTPVGGGWR